MNAAMWSQGEETRYQIQVQGYLDLTWSDWFDGMTISHEANGTTTLEGPVVDQAALYGLIGRARDLGLTLLAVLRCEPTIPDGTSTPQSQT